MEFDTTTPEKTKYQKQQERIAALEHTIGKNPHVFPLKIKVNSFSIEDQVKHDGEDWLPVEITAEYDPFTKLFTTLDRKQNIYELSSAAKELFLWIMIEVKASKDYIFMNKKRFMESNHTSLNTYKKAINELHRYAFIAPTTVKDYYWINPHYFFKGDRLKKYPANMVEVKPKKK